MLLLLIEFFEFFWSRRIMSTVQNISLSGYFSVTFMI